MEAVTTGVTSVIGWFGQVIAAVFGGGTWSALLPFIGVAVGIFIAFAAVRVIKSIISTGY